jgi:hypothetical protein
MSHCEIQRIDKPMIHSALWNTYPADVLLSKRKGVVGQSQQNCVVYFTSSRPLSLDDDETSSEFRPKIASMQNFVKLEYETGFFGSTATNS